MSNIVGVDTAAPSNQEDVRSSPVRVRKRGPRSFASRVRHLRRLEHVHTKNLLHGSSTVGRFSSDILEVSLESARHKLCPTSALLSADGGVGPDCGEW